MNKECTRGSGGEKELRRWLNLLFMAATFLDSPSGKVPKLWEKARGRGVSHISSSDWVIAR